MTLPPLPRVVLGPRKEAPFLGRHPWVFSGAVARVEGEPADGDEVLVLAFDGGFVARGLYNSQSQIRVRLYGWDPDTALDDRFFRERIERAVACRRGLGLLGEKTGCRLVFSEGDGLSGLVADRYGRWIAVQLTSLALARRMEGLLDALEEAVRPAGVYLRTEKGVLAEEGLVASDGLLRGEAPAGPLAIEENGITYRVDLATGQKTGFFLDQRENRARAARYAAGRRVADLFCYTGGFTLAMLRAGASSVVGVDVSGASLELARANLDANGLGEELAGGRVRLEESDAFRWLERAQGAGERYGTIVLDPPRFARSSRGVAQALKGYRGLNELAVGCLEPGGFLVTCSCTGRVSRAAFVDVLGEVESRTGRRIRILENRGQAPDHPVSPTCPETEYLKCLICQVE